MDDTTPKGKWSWGTTQDPDTHDEERASGDDADVTVDTLPAPDETDDAAEAEPATDAAAAADAAAATDAPPVFEDAAPATEPYLAPEPVGEPGPGAADVPPDHLAPGPAAAPRRGPGWVAVALVSAVLGAAAGGGVATLLADDGPRTEVRYTGNTSRIENPQDIQGILAKVQPGVVSIRTSSFTGNSLFGTQRVQGAGTGMIISPAGEVLTNAHVVNGATSIKVTLFNETEARDADLLGSNPASDVAVLKIRDASGLPTVQLGDSEKIRVGDEVVAIGNALALPGGPSVTTGIVSAKDRSIDAEDEHLAGLIQTDAAINPGNSGGPLVNSDGDVIGMNTAIRGDAQNIGFAIAVNTVKPMLDDLRTGGGSVTSTAFLGVSTQTLTPEIKEQFDFSVDAGAIVVETTPGSPAENAGLRRADVVVEFGGEAIETADELVTEVREKKPGDKVELVFVRGEQRRTVTVTLGSRQIGSP